MTAVPVRVTAAGAWFHPSDGGAGSLLRLAEGVAAESVRRVRDLGVPGLLPIGNVVMERGGVWLRTPQPPGPTIADLLGPDGTGLAAADDAVAVVGAVCRVLRMLHGRGIRHGRLDAGAVLLDPGGAPLLVLVEPGPNGGAADVDGVAVLARALAQAWCDDAGAERLRRCADLAGTAGLDAALLALPRATTDRSRRRAAAWAWSRGHPSVPAPRTGGAEQLDPAPDAWSGPP